MVVLRSTLDQIVAERGDGWMEEEFDITATYGNDDQALVTDELIGCTILGVENSSAEGADPNEVTLNLDIKAIKYNGKSPMKGMKI